MNMEAFHFHRFVLLLATGFIKEQFNIIDKYYWFTAFPQLISRLCHLDENVYETLETIISELICIYPHECLWQRIESYRTSTKEDRLRAERLKQTFSTAVNTAKSRKLSIDLNTLFSNYNELAGLLIGIAEKGGDKCAYGEFDNFKEEFPHISSQISSPEKENDDRVYIRGFEDNYKIFGSLEKPKLITMIGTNSVRYPMIAKRGDELRKDARCLDFCRMINTLLLRDSEARRRQLHIRTYSVIQARGGLIEIVPNLVHLRSAFASNSNERDTWKRWHQIKGDCARRRKF